MRVRALSILASILIAVPAWTAPIDDVVVSPLPGPASCYAGTPGTDHVIFLKGKTSQADCDVVGGGSPCLARREFSGDSPNGRPVSLMASIAQRPSVTGAGDFVAFAEFGFNACLMATNSEDTEGCFGRDLLGIDPHSVSISPAGTALALTRLDPFTFQPMNQIYVVNPNTFALIEAGYAVSATGPGGDALQVETVDFTVDGEYLIFDAFNPVSGLWGIYAVSRTTGVTSTVAAPVPGLIIRNPALAQTSDDHMVFDAQDSTTLQNVVFATSLLTGDLLQVASTSLQGYPSYTGDDRAVVFNELDNTVVSTASLDIQPVAANRLTPIGARSRWLTDGGVPEIYRRGAWNGTLLSPAVCEIEPDTDSDGIPDSTDNCIDVANGPLSPDAEGGTDQQDDDSDGVGNACDLLVTTSCLPSARTGKTYSQQLTAVRGQPPYTWTIIDGNPPLDVSMDSTGLISGPVQSSFRSFFTVQVTDDKGDTATQTLSIKVTLPNCVNCHATGTN